MIYKYILGLGSNIEPRLGYLKKACDDLRTVGKISGKSSIYQTQAWGNVNQSDFYNAVIEFKTKLAPRELLNELNKIENNLGRTSQIHWGPREIDIDILFCRNYSFKESDLQIPHSEFSNRRFVLEPMVELDQFFPVEGTRRTISDFLNACQDDLNVKKLTLKW